MTGPVWVRVGDVRAVVGPPRGPRHPTPTWLVLGASSADGSAGRGVAFGTFALEGDEITSLRIINGDVPDDVVPALLEAGRALWGRR